MRDGGACAAWLHFDVSLHNLNLAALTQIVCIVGTRPEVIKMAPVIRALRAEGRFRISVLCSDQHRELVVPLFEWFAIPVDANLGAMTENQNLAQLTSRLIDSFHAYFSRVRPDLVIGQGDTTTVMSAALCCFYDSIQFAHVEAGLRTHNLRYPFPEEFNRVMVGQLAQIHFCPTEGAKRNLLAEGVAASSTHVTGNTVIDALEFTCGKLPRDAGKAAPQVLLTVHRRENLGAPLESIFRAVLNLCRKFPQLSVIYPVHPNPNVALAARRFLAGHAQISLVAPLNYPDLVAAMRSSRFILTDSGGLQEEGPALGKPVLVLRQVTERPEAIEAGVARLVGVEEKVIFEECSALLTDAAHYKSMSSGSSPYGDGKAATRISSIIANVLRE